MCKGYELLDWSELGVKRGQEVVIEIQGQKEPVTARNKEDYMSLKRQKLARSTIKNWYVQNIPDATVVSS